MYWVFYRPGEDWVESGRHDKEQALQSYTNYVFLYGITNVKLLQEVPNANEGKCKLTISIDGMGTAISPPDDEADTEPSTIDSKEVDEQLVEEASQKSPLSHWGVLARTARINTMHVRVRTTGLYLLVGYFIGIGSDNEMYSILKQDDGSDNMKVYYENITSIEFLGDDEQ